jgi:hypothetical protein
MTCLGVLDREERSDDNGTSLKEGGGIEMSIYSASIYVMHAPSLLIYLPIVCDIDRVMTLTLFGGNVHIDPLPGGLGLPLPSIFFAVLGLY